MNLQPRPAMLWASIAVSLSLCTAVALVPVVSLRGHRIASGVFIEDVPVGGMSAPAVPQFLNEKLAGSSLNLEWKVFSWKIPLRQAGGTPRVQEAADQAAAVGRTGWWGKRVWDIMVHWRQPENVPLAFAFEDAKLQQIVRQIAWQINRPARDARLDLQEKQLHVIPEESGRAVLVPETASQIAQGYSARHDTFTVSVREVPPAIHSSDLQAIDTPLVTFSTWYSAGQRNRSSNIRLCAALIHGLVVMPGQTFSFNERIGERTPSKGFRLAPVFINKKKAMGIGGGVCQVSSTVFNAAYNAGLKIVERHRHSLPVGYVPEGRDATVAFPSSDMRFQNTSDTPLFIEARAQGGLMTVRLWGRADAQIARSQVTARVRKVVYPTDSKPKAKPKPAAQPPAAPADNVPPEPVLPITPPAPSTSG